ncbi:MAG: hypothetical protein ACREKH_15620, partial [Candidatus Rokuibacteriota bacterium]
LGFSYYRCTLDSGAVLVVKRITRLRDRDYGRWLWMHRGPEVVRNPPIGLEPPFGLKLNGSGVAKTLIEAQEAARRHDPSTREIHRYVP